MVCCCGLSPGVCFQCCRHALSTHTRTTTTHYSLFTTIPSTILVPPPPNDPPTKQSPVCARAYSLFGRVLQPFIFSWPPSLLPVPGSHSFLPVTALSHTASAPVPPLPYSAGGGEVSPFYHGTSVVGSYVAGSQIGRQTCRAYFSTTGTPNAVLEVTEGVWVHADSLLPPCRQPSRGGATHETSAGVAGRQITINSEQACTEPSMSGYTLTPCRII